MRWNCLEHGDTRVPSTPRLPVPHLKSITFEVLVRGGEAGEEGDWVVVVVDGLDGEDREGNLASRSCDKCVAASNHTQCPCASTSASRTCFQTTLA